MFLNYCRKNRRLTKSWESRRRECLLTVYLSPLCLKTNEDTVASPKARLHSILTCALLRTVLWIPHLRLTRYLGYISKYTKSCFCYANLDNLIFQPWIFCSPNHCFVTAYIFNIATIPDLSSEQCRSLYKNVSLQVEFPSQRSTMSNHHRILESASS